MQNPSSIILGNDIKSQTVCLFFGAPISQLILTAEQAEALAVELFQRAQALKEGGDRP